MSIALVQKNVVESSASTVSVSLTSTSSGSAIVVSVVSGQIGNFTISDNKSNSYSLNPIGNSFNSGNPPGISTKIALNCTAGVTSVSISNPFNTDLIVSVMEFSGVVTTSARDAAAGSFGTSTPATAPYAGGTVISSGDLNYVLLGGMAAGVALSSVGTGFTGLNSKTGTTYILLDEYLIENSTTPTTPTFNLTLTGTLNQKEWVMGSVELKAA